MLTDQVDPAGSDGDGVGFAAVTGPEVVAEAVGHLVAHEAYPGHHTEHTRKEVGLVRRRHWHEETIFLVGTPQCTLAEGLADLGAEVTLGRRPEPVVAGHLAPLGVRYDADVAAAVADAGEAMGVGLVMASSESGGDGDPTICLTLGCA